jgi:hypothetical protein
LNSLTQQSSPADPKAVIDAVARRNQIRVLVDGMTAANDLGFTNAVPAKTIVHTDARAKAIKLGNLTITFKLTAASKLYWVGRPAMKAISLPQPQRGTKSGTLARRDAGRTPCARTCGPAGVRQGERQECQRVSSKTPHPYEREARARARPQILPLSFA